MKLTQVDFESLKEYIEIAYEEDEKLLSQYHIQECSFEEAVDMTCKMIEYTAHGLDMKYFGVMIGENKIGYLCTLPNNLYSFGVNINFRTKDILKVFGGLIVEKLGDSFICMLFPNNWRAINWLEKCGMKIVPDVEENAVTLLYHK